MALFFLSLIFGHYRQLLDPNSPAYVSRSHSGYPLGVYPQQYVGNPPPPGPPPANYERGDQPFVPPYDSAKLPTYEASGKTYGGDAKDGQGLLKTEGNDPFGNHRNNAGRSDPGY